MNQLPRAEYGRWRCARRQPCWDEVWKRGLQTINSRVPIYRLKEVQGVVTHVTRLEYRALHQCGSQIRAVGRARRICQQLVTTDGNAARLQCLQEHDGG